MCCRHHITLQEPRAIASPHRAQTRRRAVDTQWQHIECTHYWLLLAWRGGQRHPHTAPTSILMRDTCNTCSIYRHDSLAVHGRTTPKILYT